MTNFYKDRDIFLASVIGILLLGIGVLCAENSGFAGTEKREKSQKVIDFEGDVVEGMNRQPLDSLKEISEGKNKKKKVHLYRKRKSFRAEVHESLREMRYLR